LCSPIACAGHQSTIRSLQSDCGRTVAAGIDEDSRKRGHITFEDIGGERMRFFVVGVALAASLCLTAPALATTHTPAGGANQKAATQGCLNQWLFNGIWRLKVDSIAALSDPSMVGWYGWGATVEVRNGTTRDDYTLAYTGLTDMDLAFADASTLSITATAAGHSSWGTISSHQFPQASSYKQLLDFWYPVNTKQSDVQKPTKLLALFDPKPQAYHAGTFHEPNFTTPTPSFRVDLTCTK
jgi:hypothetical protein